MSLKEPTIIACHSCTWYGGWICCHDVLHQLGEGCSCKGRRAGRALVHDAAKRPQVAGSALRRILKQLWRHVGRRCPLYLPQHTHMSDLGRGRKTQYDKQTPDIADAISLQELHSGPCIWQTWSAAQHTSAQSMGRLGSASI